MRARTKQRCEAIPVIVYVIIAMASWESPFSTRGPGRGNACTPHVYSAHALGASGLLGVRGLVRLDRGADRMVRRLTPRLPHVVGGHAAGARRAVRPVAAVGPPSGGPGLAHPLQVDGRRAGAGDLTDPPTRGRVAR